MAAVRTTARITGALTRLTGRSMTRSFLGGSGDGYLPEPYGISGSSFSTTAAAAEESPERMFGLLKDYEDYRRAMYGGLTHKALLVDAVGTLVIPSQPMAQVGFSLCLTFRAHILCINTNLTLFLFCSFDFVLLFIYFSS